LYIAFTIEAFDATFRLSFAYDVSKRKRAAPNRIVRLFQRFTSRRATRSLRWATTMRRYYGCSSIVPFDVQRERIWRTSGVEALHLWKDVALIPLWVVGVEIVALGPIEKLSNSWVVIARLGGFAVAVITIFSTSLWIGRVLRAAELRNTLFLRSVELLAICRRAMWNPTGAVPLQLDAAVVQFCRELGRLAESGHAKADDARKRELRDHMAKVQTVLLAYSGAVLRDGTSAMGDLVRCVSMVQDRLYAGRWLCLLDLSVLVGVGTPALLSARPRSRFRDIGFVLLVVIVASGTIFVANKFHLAGSTTVLATLTTSAVPVLLRRVALGGSASDAWNRISGALGATTGGSTGSGGGQS
jgi:hypothetical protein